MPILAVLLAAGASFGNCRNAALMAAFDQRLAEIVAAFEGGQRIVEVR